MKLIAITGGIGSGKSVVSSVLRILGYAVYDCDSEAKRLMNTSQSIKSDIIEAFGTQSMTTTNTINSAYISKLVFNDDNALKKLNSIVHPMVKQDILDKVAICKQNVMFVETAILMQSNLLDIIDDAWIVEAPEDLRVKRVMKRNSISAEEVISRIRVQKNQDFSLLAKSSVILNDGVTPLLPQVLNLL